LHGFVFAAAAAAATFARALAVGSGFKSWTGRRRIKSGG
jgi:hypothetical protein